MKERSRRDHICRTCLRCLKPLSRTALFLFHQSLLLGSIWFRRLHGYYGLAAERYTVNNTQKLR